MGVELSRGFAALEDAEFAEILRLQRLYYREARKCQTAKAYLPACVMLGAALEAGLIAMVHCFSDEVAACKSAPHEKGRVKPLLQWQLAELLRVAKTLHWLPSCLHLSESWDAKRAIVGDHAEVMRMLRNLAHPARYLADHPGKRVTGRHLSHSFEALEVAQHHLQRELNNALRAAMKTEDGT